MHPRDVLTLNQHYSEGKQSLLLIFWYMILEQLLFVFVKIQNFCKKKDVKKKKDVFRLVNLIAQTSHPNEKKERTN